MASAETYTAHYTAGTGGSVQQGLSAAGRTVAAITTGPAADKRSLLGLTGQTVAHHDKSTQIQDALLAPSSRPMETAIGWVSVFAAAALATFDLFTLTAIVRGSSNLTAAWTILALSTVLTYFFASVGYRLVRDRPNKVGSIASLTVWFTCFVAFSILTLLFIAAAVAKRDAALAQGAALSALLALLAYGAASNFRHPR